MGGSRGLGGASKRQRTVAAEAGAAAPLRSPICEALLSEASRASLRAAYAAAAPYPHGVLRPLCDDGALRCAFEEMRAYLSGTFKETDLFKLYQTGDLGSMAADDAALAARIPHLLSLRDAIYSPDFRDFIRDVTGCGPLSDRVDCSCNLYVRGSHLLCHDDVIGTRRVSYIIYLTEPDEGWAPRDGGALELYPLADSGRPGEPAIAPSAALLPLWNSMAFFTVLPGRSFHAVQEVFEERKLRMSISGWFHAADAPADAALATLAQLQAPAEDGSENDSAFEGPLQPLPGLPPPAAGADDAALAPGALSGAERALLAEWVSGEYLKLEAQAAVAKRFKRDSSVQLHAFLRADKAAALAAATAAADAAAGLGNGAPPSSYDAGVVGGWQPVGPSHKQRFLRYDVAADVADSPADVAGGLLLAAARQLFASAAFAKLLWHLTELRVTAGRTAARRFRPGLDYTVAHYGVLTRAARLDATLAFVDDGGGAAAASAAAASDDEPDARAVAWQSGEVGGFECYLSADESAEGATAADVYRADPSAQEDDLLSVSAAANTLSLVHRDEGIMRFVRYVSAAAPGSRWDVSAEYAVLVPEGSSSDEEEEEEEEEE